MQNIPLFLVGQSGAIAFWIALLAATAAMHVQASESAPAIANKAVEPLNWTIVK